MGSHGWSEQRPGAPSAAEEHGSLLAKRLRSSWFVVAAFVFDPTNGFHASSNVVAALVATGAARPAQALVLASTCHVLGPLRAGTAVADTVGAPAAAHRSCARRSTLPLKRSRGAAPDAVTRPRQPYHYYL